MAPKYVTPYRMSGKQGKNDAADVAAICEAVQRPNMRFVPIKSMDLQSRLLVHRARPGFVEARTAIALIEGAPLYEHPAPKEVPKMQAANGASIDRQLPAHVPRENQVHRPAATNAAHETAGDECGCTACGGRLRQIGAKAADQD